jgi:hypothetical protein
VPADTITAPTAPGPADPSGQPPLPSTRVRRLWKVGGAALAVILLPYGVVQAVTQLAHEERTEIHEFPADGVRTIEIHSSNGTVRVVGDDSGGGQGGTISVTAHISDGLRSTGHHERVEGDRLVLDSSCPMFFSSFCEVTYTVETPPDVDVEVRSSMGVTVEGIEGDVDVQTAQGTVELARIDGDISTDTDQGAVRASGLRSEEVEATTDQGEVLLRFDEPPRRVTADSDQGDVEIVLPEDDTEYKLSTDTDQGSVEREIRNGPNGTNPIRATTDQGDVILRYP